MIVFAGVFVVLDSSVATQMVIGGVSLVSIIVTAYTGWATYEDAKLYPKQQLGDSQDG